jgi:hypothetical protein
MSFIPKLIYTSEILFKIINCVQNTTETYSIKVTSGNLRNIHDNFKKIIEIIYIFCVYDVMYFISATV